MKTKERKYYLYMLCVGVLWGTISTFIKFLEYAGSTPSYSAFLRMSTGFIFLFIITCIKEGISALKVTKRTFLISISMGFFLQGLYNLSYNMAVHLLGVTLPVVILNLSPIVTATFSMLLFHENITKRKYISISLNIIGCILVATNGVFSNFSLSIIGILYALLTAACYGLTPIVTRFTDSRDSSMAIAIYAALGTVLFYCFLSPWNSTHSPLDPKLLLLGAVYGLFTCGLADTLYYTGLQKITESSRVPVLLSGNTLIAPILGIMVFHEYIGPVSMIGIILVLYSIAMNK